MLVEMKDIELEPIVKFHASVIGGEYWEQRNMETLESIVETAATFWLFEH